VFHEVGAIDSIVDIVGAAAALDWLAPASASCAQVAMGHGTVRTAHGLLPVPSPAAVEILRHAGGVMASGGVARELCTPTGAAILAHTVTTWQPAPTGVPLASGWGAGDMELPDRPNVLRLLLVATPALLDGMWRLEANVDDMSPELCGFVSEAMFAAGAADVWWSAITMKKGRPAWLLSALAPTAARDAVIRVLLTETSSIGVRFDPVERQVLDRDWVTVELGIGAVRVKRAHLAGAVVNAAPEYDDCALLARKTGRALKDIFALAMAAYARTL
jgi:uncharacterized protein (TIGR00299 family) protein